MMRNNRFTFVCSEDERRILAALADYLNRSQSDALRLLIREAARELITDANAHAARSTDAAPRSEGVKHAIEN
ncbi:MAG: hypothetical protein BroJett039_04590 [Chloroflexota bacterium]|nr:MAG: hypothetical protein BroJett039_04590 [Chloroflexota bacterium]